MDTDRTHIIKNNSRKRSPRSKAQTRKGSNERDIMDFKNWGPLEGYACQVSAIPDLPSAFLGMDRTRDLSGNHIQADKRSVRTREDRYPGGVHRQEFCTGRKSGLAVGKTKRGKGTKIMAIADASDFPVAACTVKVFLRRLIVKRIEIPLNPFPVIKFFQ